VAVPRQRYRGAPHGAQGSPRRASLEEQVEPCGRGRCGPAWRSVDEPVCGEFDAVLEDEGGRDECMELLAGLIKTVREIWGRKPLEGGCSQPRTVRCRGDPSDLRSRKGSRSANRADSVCSFAST
jgi:hypothetical protein